MREALKKPVFVHAQNWYKPGACADCKEFNFVLLPDGAAAYCEKIEEDQCCILNGMEEQELELHTSTLVTLEALSPNDQH